MDNNEKNSHEEIFSKSLRAGRRTYFFDVRETRAGDYYLTITESKKNSNEDGTFYFKKHKIYLYKEDFQSFKEHLEEATDFITREKGEEVISERHQPDYNEKVDANEDQDDSRDGLNKFTDISFEDI
ncbi:PUR family DNA/RNA-binding protein [Weeksellaceae bacterium KMM 9713]|uniref:PUR family DNA/RNA-binding protein n=1 Tax=Profundicola chukchiensis TaxID=2961959 RepID=A0A9X4MU93_9FLAO|nr:PUR family DNA/RNA-binding protein [Profundicola chukchiensis]MDG4945021.1 PUR family DNA/RNA-binding protein [Profundicola chukchiensis]MDG4950104.1 PUR family DNA/RNA-binding protein [Profundicola chukchiensis]